jgi:hypothetical protein
LPIVSEPRSWHRIHRADQPALHFGRAAANRFDDPLGEFGVLYVGADPHCCFVETFGQNTGARLIAQAALAQRSLARIEADRALRLVDLTGVGLARIGADERLNAGAHDAARRWSRALWDHPDRPDGVLYRARHDPSRTCAALYDRAAETLRTTPLGRLDDHSLAPTVAAILDAYGFALAPRRAGR